MMRDPARLPIILNKIATIWRKYPDLRLGQLIINSMVGIESASQAYSYEDDNLDFSWATKESEGAL
jgi:hypothetical protein